MSRKRKARYGTTMHDDEKRRGIIYLICAVILLICGILDVIFLIGILS